MQLESRQCMILSLPFKFAEACGVRKRQTIKDRLEKSGKNERGSGKLGAAGKKAGETGFEWNPAEQ